MLRNKYHLIVILSILLICFCGNLPALDPNKATTQYVHEYWTGDQGLPQNSVISILQSRDGYLWLGIEQGLVRFDGVRFTVYDMGTIPEMKSNMIWNLHEGRDGSLWISTHNGGVTHMKNGKWTTYTKEEKLSENFVFFSAAICKNR